MMTAINQVFDGPGNRPSSPDIMIVITGNSDGTNVTQAQQISASQNISVISIGIGNGVNQQELQAISGSLYRTLNTPDYGSLQGLLLEICNNLKGKSSFSIPGNLNGSGKK
uniref:VWFA domain-containing protein n=1 Tax=Acrobeloides nanus TaxID=290746 RepID=A0A914DEK4_9BILA